MFPLVHYFVNRKIYGRASSLMILGGMWPDLAIAAGGDRDGAHRMGGDFYSWCQAHDPSGLDLARGVLSHGLRPHCVDYYADEDWPGSAKGWCFAAGGPFMPRVEAATRLPRRFVWWKAHNFVEMAYELLTDEQAPYLCGEIMAAIADQGAKEQAAELLAAYSGLPARPIRELFDRIPKIYAVEKTGPLELATRQKTSLAMKPGVGQVLADVDDMARLISQMSQELRGGYQPFMQRLLELVGPVLLRY